MISHEGFLVAVKFIKANYRLAEIDDDTLQTWWQGLEDESFDNKMLLKATKQIIKTQKSWFEKGMGFPALILEQVENIRNDMRYQEPEGLKQLPMSDKEQADNDKGRKEFSDWNRKLKAKMKGDLR